MTTVQQQEEESLGVGEATVLHGDCLQALKEMESDSLDACVTDPPYGLSKEPDVAEVMRHWLAGDDYKHKGSGFMGKSWDSFVPGPSVWREVYRVMKPGAHLLCFSGTRTWDLMSMAIRLAGFENRDTIRHHFGEAGPPPAIAWVTGSGFPKSLNVSKAIDRMAGAEREVLGPATHIHSRGKTTAYPKRPGEKAVEESGRKVAQTAEAAVITAPATEAAKQWEGWGTALKPSWEVILVFRKPLSESSIARNVLKHSTGAINVESSRVDGKRFPSNLLLSHVSPDENGIGGCKRVGEKRVRGSKLDHFCTSNSPQIQQMRDAHKTGHTDADGMETVESWDCEPQCPCRLMDEQSAVSRSKHNPKPSDCGDNTWGGTIQVNRGARGHTDKGGASRFFKTFSPDVGSGFVYQAKAACKDRGEGNTHPTCKPTALMKYLVRLVTPPGGTVLDCFAGSGSTLVAAQELGISAIGIEQDTSYVSICEKRLEATRPQSSRRWESLSLLEGDDSPLG